MIQEKEGLLHDQKDFKKNEIKQDHLVSLNYKEKDANNSIGLEEKVFPIFSDIINDHNINDHNINNHNINNHNINRHNISNHNEIINREKSSNQISNINSNSSMIESKNKLAEKTKLSFANGIFDASLLITHLKDLSFLLQVNNALNPNRYINLGLISVSLVLQLIVFGILSFLTVVKDKIILEKMNNSVVVITSFIFLFELLRGFFLI